MTIVDLGGCGFTLASLESVLDILNLKTEVQLKNVGHTDIMRLAMDLYNYADKQQAATR